MAGGRPRKPREVKQKEGTLRPSRDYIPAVIGNRGELLPPKRLSKAAKEVWGEIMPDLVESGVVRSVDARIFAQFCEAVALADAMVPKLAKAVVTQPSGRVAKSPAVEVWVAAVATARQLAEQYGLTPAARAKLGIQTTTKSPGQAAVDKHGASPRLRAVDGGNG